MAAPSQSEKDLIRSLLEPDDRVALALVFGSVARGTSTPRSDLDVAVAGPRLLTDDERVELAQRLARAVGREVDLVDLGAARGLVASEALTGGVLLLNRDPELYARILRRTWFDRADFGPLRSRILEARRERAFGAGKKKGAKDAG
jgi:predicted nucleotidyltransferase